jgi:hypothetical protein
LGEHFNRAPYDLIIRIQNVGSTDLTLDTSMSNYPCEISAESQVSVIQNQPAGAIIAPGTYLEFNLSMTPTANTTWSVQLDIHSDDSDESPYTIVFTGVSTKRNSNDDESCSTGDSGSGGYLMLGGLLSLLALGARLRDSR